MGFGIQRLARSTKRRGGLRGLFGGKPPDAKELGERLPRLARRMLPGVVSDASAKRITLAFHPGASPARLLITAEGDLELRAETSALGPGYQAHVIAALGPLLEELEFAWEPDPDADEDMLAWLADELRAGKRAIGMPAERVFLVDDADVLTALGPRDAAWRARVIADPQAGLDAFPWPSEGPGRAALARALVAMWHEVPWREPLDDRERKVMGQVDLDLEEAYRADKTLPIPWADWHELLVVLGIDDDKRLDRLRKRAGDAQPAIGYRRHPMEIELAGGWTMTLSGNFAGHWEDDDARWWATDGERVVEFTSLTANNGADSAALLAVAAEAHPVLDRFTDGDRCGRAEAFDDGAVRVVTGLVARAPDVGILTCKGDPDDEPWALATWRSLRIG
ncbi:MAG: hypothetical protein KIT31_21955 [Deltaproteobacteria bacterium]|nr:hypothetical protein [Deltaproteobacteria bacterium]